MRIEFSQSVHGVLTGGYLLQIVAQRDGDNGKHGTVGMSPSVAQTQSDVGGTVCEQHSNSSKCQQQNNSAIQQHISSKRRFKMHNLMFSHWD